MTPPSTSTPPPENRQDLGLQVALLTQTVENLRKDLETLGILRDQWLQANLNSRVENLESRVKKVEEILVGMRPAVQTMTKIGWAIIVLIVSLIFALITGQAHVVYP
jgi:hypothetical protein